MNYQNDFLQRSDNEESTNYTYFIHKCTAMNFKFLRIHCFNPHNATVVRNIIIGSKPAGQPY